MLNQIRPKTIVNVAIKELSVHMKETLKVEASGSGSTNLVSRLHILAG
jgi:hypothetical protein